MFFVISCLEIRSRPLLDAPPVLAQVAAHAKTIIFLKTPEPHPDYQIPDLLYLEMP